MDTFDVSSMEQATALWIRQQLYGTGNSFKEQATLGHPWEIFGTTVGQPFERLFRLLRMFL